MPDVSAKQPFVLPDFYVPWPARLNPNREAARLHAGEWAREMGMVRAREDGSGGEGAGLWDAARFDAMDFALMAAYTHPDAPGPELELLTDWYAWSFYYDDYFHAVGFVGYSLKCLVKAAERLVERDADAAHTHGAEGAEAERKRAVIEAALARARARRSGGTPG